MPIKAIEIADWFIVEAAKEKIPLTKLKVQSLLYYAETTYQVLNKKELFEEQLQAWPTGPVVPEVFYKLTDDEIKYASRKSTSLPKKVKRHLYRVLIIFGGLSEESLSTMSRNELPWITARGDLDPEERCETVIPKKEIRGYFKTKYKQYLS